ncbi:MAG: hypothetical protein KBH94_06365 [Caldisericia bacterium]|nr:hypothetical protein [Caldisericia bacterium]
MEYTNSSQEASQDQPTSINTEQAQQPTTDINTKIKKKPVFLIVLVIILLLLCGYLLADRYNLFNKPADIANKNCEYNGNTYVGGETFPSVDGCNTCGCDGETGTVSCTEKACYKDCTYNGQTYTNGETFKATDGCNTCECDGTTGKVTCTQIKCPTDPYQGWKTYTSEVFKYSVKYPSDAEISPDNEDACCMTTISLAVYNHLQHPNGTILINSYDESSDDDIQRKLNEIKGYGWKDDKYTVTNSTIGGYSATSVEGYLYMGIRDAGGSPVYSYGTYILVKPNKDLHIIAAWDDENRTNKDIIEKIINSISFN